MSKLNRLPPSSSQVPEETDRWIDEREVSAITGMSPAWLQRKRWAGDGIPYAKLPRAVRYRLSVVRAWMESHTTHSTSEDTG